METVAYEIAQNAAAPTGRRLPVPHAHAHRRIFHIPSCHHVAQVPNLALCDHVLGLLPCGELREVEIDHVRATAALRGCQQVACSRKIWRKRLLYKDGLAALEGAR